MPLRDMACISLPIISLEHQIVDLLDRFRRGAQVWLFQAVERGVGQVVDIEQGRLVRC